MKELLAKLLDDDEDMLDLHLSAKAAEADARTAALQRLSLDASRPAAADGAVSVSIRRTKCVPCILRLAACAALPAESMSGCSRVPWRLLKALMACPQAAELRTSCCAAHHCASTPQPLTFLTLSRRSRRRLLATSCGIVQPAAAAMISPPATADLPRFKYTMQEPPATPRHEQEEDEARTRSEEALDYTEQLLEAYFMQVGRRV